MPALFRHRSVSHSLSSTKDTGIKTLLVCCALSLILAIASSQAVFSVPRLWLETVADAFALPVRYVSSVISIPFGALNKAFINSGADTKTLSELKEENAQLSSRVAELEETKQTSVRLQNLLALKSSYNLQSVAARIIGTSHNSWEANVVIDKGTSSGLQVGMPVVGANGAIGQIVECSALSSTVRLLRDEKSSISAMIQNSRAQGVVQGSIDATIRLQFINTNLEAHMGDIVVTSGLGGIFPKGLPIGKITSVNKAPGSMYYDIRISAFSETENLEEVLVITSLTEEQKANDKDVAAADAQDASTNQDATSLKDPKVSSVDGNKESQSQTSKTPSSSAHKNDTSKKQNNVSQGSSGRSE